jgi:hypothetical protein
MQLKPARVDPTIAQIHRLLLDSLPTKDEPFPWYLPAGGLADLNALLDIVDDEDFIDAVVWQLHGREIVGAKRRRWLKRLARTSRSGIVVLMRCKVAGRRHAVEVPGMWIALLFDPPVWSLARKLPGRRIRDRIRQRLISWRLRIAFAQRATPASQTTEESTVHPSPWKRAG